MHYFSRSLASLLLLFGLGCFTGAFAQSNVPASVQNQFQSDFPNSQDVEWETSESNYEVEFEVNGTEMEVVYDQAGKMLAKEEAVAWEAVPMAVRNTIEGNFPGAQVSEQEKVTEGGRTLYEFEAVLNGRKIEMQFDEWGTMLEMEEESEKN